MPHPPSDPSDPSGPPVPPEAVDPRAPGLARPVVMNQDWRDLTYLHWAVDPALVASRMPRGVRPDTLNGVTYVGLVPFRMVDAGFGPTMSVPWLGTFLETNVRLYSVDDSGRRGIVFLSLDTDRAAVVAGARASLALPYRWARMRHRSWVRSGRRHHGYDARLRWPGVRGRSRLEVRVGDAREATGLDHFLTARWGLHTTRLHRTLYVPNRHGVWPLHDAEVTVLEDELVRSVGLGDLASRTPDHVAFSPGVHTDFALRRAPT